MRELFKFLVACAILMAFYFATTLSFELFHPRCPQGTELTLNPPFPKYGTGVAYSASLPSLEKFSDTIAAQKRSNYVVCENGYAMGPAHSFHVDIITNGKGRFSHWTETGFVFSASDNSDPNTNKRRYHAVEIKK
jgi:hypothetical protein